MKTWNKKSHNEGGVIFQHICFIVIFLIVTWALGKSKLIKHLTVA